MKIRLIIADDHAVVRSGLHALLAAQSDIEVVGEAEDGADVVEQCRKLKPDLVLLDLTMPGRGGVAAAEELAREFPDVKVLVLTMHEDEAYARQARLAGAAGYVLKRALATELVKAIRKVHQGGHYAPDSLAEAFDDAGSAVPSPMNSGTLSKREREVLALIALGHTNAEIGKRLHISEKTVETHRAHILKKLGMRTRADLVRFALEHGLMKA